MLEPEAILSTLASPKPTQMPVVPKEEEKR